MTGDPTVSWRDYVDRRFDAQKEAVAAALAAADRAVAKAESAAERRFEAQNEFRGTLSDQARLLMPRAEAEQAFKTINDKIDGLSSRVSSREDRGQGRGDVWGFIVGAAGFVAAVVSIAFAMMRHA